MHDVWVLEACTPFLGYWVLIYPGRVLCLKRGVELDEAPLVASCGTMGAIGEVPSGRFHQRTSAVTTKPVIHERGQNKTLLSLVFLSHINILTTLGPLLRTGQTGTPS